MTGSPDWSPADSHRRPCAIQTIVTTDSGARFELNCDGGGAATLRLSGRFDARSTSAVWRELRAALRPSLPSKLEVNASGIEFCDGAGLALLHFLSVGGMSSSGLQASVSELRPEFLNLFKKITAEDYQKYDFLPKHQNCFQPVIL